MIINSLENFINTYIVSEEVDYKFELLLSLLLIKNPDTQEKEIMTSIEAIIT